MKTTLDRRPAIFAGFLLLSLLLLAVALGPATAQTISGTGLGSGTAVTAHVPPGAAGAAAVRHAALDAATKIGAASPARPVSQGGAGTALWILLGVALAVALVAWAIGRMSGRTARAASPSTAFCSLHPEDARCVAA